MKQPKRKGPKFRVGQVVLILGADFTCCRKIKKKSLYVGGEYLSSGWRYILTSSFTDSDNSYWESELRPLNDKEVGPGWRRKEH